jgi:predicted Zn finger-like uncharacterized protein
MRLVCPNCDAEYEVDASAIPEGGRDVQCSACGHAWFQLPPDVIAAKEDEAALYDPQPAAAVIPPAAVTAVEPARTAMPPEPDAIPDLAPEPEPADLPPEPAPEPMTAARVDATAEPAPSSSMPGRSLDESLMAVLREEAEREAQARKAESAGLEMQTEMPLAGPAATTAMPAAGGPDTALGPATIALRKIAKLRGEPEPKPPVPTKADITRPRRELLPEIEEINSSLRAVSEKREADQGAVADTMHDIEPRSGGFRRGFLTVMILVILGAALYIAAPILSARVPALAGVMAAYVQGVDALRMGLDGLARLITSKLTGVTGGQG